MALCRSIQIRALLIQKCPHHATAIIRRHVEQLVVQSQSQFAYVPFANESVLRFPDLLKRSRSVFSHHSKRGRFELRLDLR